MFEIHVLMFAMPIVVHKQLSLFTLKCAILLCKKNHIFRTRIGFQIPLCMEPKMIQLKKCS
jgi:hypothetical protein